MPLKPRPNTAETMKSPASLCVARNRPWQQAAKPSGALVRAAEAAGMEALGCEANP
jgi:hypothetical protein